LKEYLEPKNSAREQLDRAALHRGEVVIFRGHAATFLRALNEKNALIQVGSVRVAAPFRALYAPISKGASEVRGSLGYDVEFESKEDAHAAVAALDVRGLRLSEALDALSHQVDAARLARPYQPLQSSMELERVSLPGEFMIG